MGFNKSQGGSGGEKSLMGIVKTNSGSSGFEDKVYNSLVADKKTISPLQKTLLGLVAGGGLGALSGALTKTGAAQGAMLGGLGGALLPYIAQRNAQESDGSFNQSQRVRNIADNTIDSNDNSNTAGWAQLAVNNNIVSPDDLLKNAWNLQGLQMDKNSRSWF